MKFLLLLFFAFTTPLVIFLTTLLYGGVSPKVVKDELAQSNFYTNVTAYIAEMSSEDTGDEVSSEVTGIITNRFTPEYLQSKAEPAIDDTHNWITGKTQTAPVISFKDIKEDILAQNPELLTSLTDMSQEMENMPVEDAYAMESEDSSQEVDMSALTNSIAQLQKSDFTIQIGDHFKGLKQTYEVLQIALPVLIGLLLGSLVFQAVLSHEASSRLRWLGATLMITGLVGFGTVALNAFIVSALMNFQQVTNNELAALFTPTIFQVIKHFVEIFTNYQGMLSVAFLIAAALSFVASEVVKKKPVPVQKVSMAKKK